MKKNIYIRWLLTVFFYVFTLYSYAQNGTIAGSISNGEGPLSSATVAAGGKLALTDKDGAFFFSLQPGTYTLLISHAGYKKITEQVTVKASNTHRFNFTMVADGQLGEVVVLGSHAATHHRNLHTTVPVDVLHISDLSKNAYSDVKLMVFEKLPSFYSPTQAVGLASMLEPATLKGLSPDQVLVLVNGRRRHNLAFLYLQNTIGRGTAGTDLNAIPASAIEKVEVLRDGAAAQYGSDAIAGVINIELKKSTGKTFIGLQTGQQYKNDGAQLNLGINHGFLLNKKGFLDLSADIRYRNSTDRTGDYQGFVYWDVRPFNTVPHYPNSDSLRALDNQKITERGFSKDKVAKIGVPELLNTGIVINGGYPLNKTTHFFLTGSFNCRKSENNYAGSTYRFPKKPSFLNTEIYPDGFLFYLSTLTLDASGLVGLEGKTAKGWQWDISSEWGGNSENDRLMNSNNASQQFTLGKLAQTEFYIGTVIFRQFTNNINLTRNFARPVNKVESLNLALGAEFRNDNYQVKAGEESSWKNYDPTGQKPGGSQGVPGLRREEDAVNADRKVASVYADIEVAKNQYFLLAIAGRYEHYSDFGGNLSGKLALRYKFSDRFSLRAAINSGYRAPAMQQAWFSRLSQVTVNLRSRNTEIFRNNSEVVRAFGIPPLHAEKSININSGFTLQLGSSMSLAVDAWWIQIRDRIVLTGGFPDSIPAVKQILANHPDVQSAAFFTNAINTQALGLDILWSGKWNIHRGMLVLDLSASLNRTELFGEIQTSPVLPDNAQISNIVLDPEQRGIIERSQPRERIIAGVDYAISKFGFHWSSTYFGKTAHYNPGTGDSARGLDEFFRSKIINTCMFRYQAGPAITLTIGARNLFNVYPDPKKNFLNTQEGILRYDFTASQFGINGGYYFVSMSFVL